MDHVDILLLLGDSVMECHIAYLEVARPESAYQPTDITGSIDSEEARGIVIM